MRAAVFKGAGSPWVIETRADPVPGAGEAVIKVGRAGICGTDISFTSGNGYDFPADTVLGHEYSGEIVAVGSGVSGLRTGDLVASIPCAGCGHCPHCAMGHDVLCARGSTGYMGGFGEYMTIAERSTVKLPAALGLADGALVEPLAVGLHGVGLAELRPGAKVLVLGAGSVGLTAIHAAKRAGATVIAASRTNRREALALKLGADAFVLTGDGEAERMAEALGGPPDVVFECAGAVGMLQRAINLVKVKGLVVSLGFCMMPDPVIPGIATFREVTLKFSMAYTLAEFRQVIDALDAGHLEPRDMVSEVIALDAMPAMIEQLRAGYDAAKVHVDPWAVA